MLTSGKWGAGPTLVALQQTGPWTIGLLTNQIWSFAGDPGRRDLRGGGRLDIYGEYPVDLRLGCEAVVCAPPCADFEVDEDWPTTGQHRGGIEILGGIPDRRTAWFRRLGQHILYPEMTRHARRRAAANALTLPWAIG